MNEIDSIYRKYHNRLFLYSLKFIENENDALDIVQEVFVTVWEKEKYLLEEEHLNSFLFGSVRNGCLNFLKHESVKQKHQNSEKYKLTQIELYHYKSGEKSLIEKDDLDKIYSAINSLSDKHKEVITLSRFEGLKNSQIADKLDIPIRTVETRLYRALSELKQKLSKKLIYLFLC
jgi:RNA polymerase sigma-70 factor (ECF subfamily)